MKLLRAIANVPAGTNFHDLVAGTAGKKIRVVGLDIQAGGVATEVTFYSEVTAVSPLYALGANGGKVLPFDDSAHGWFETALEGRLRVKTGAGSAVGVLVLYILVNENGTV